MIQYPRQMDLRQIAFQGGLPWAIPRIEARLSNFAREQGAIPVSGQAYDSDTIINVRWLSSAPLIAIWTLESAFLLLTIRRCCGAPDRVLWKTSSLPLIYHGFEHWDVVGDIGKAAAAGGGVDTVSGMERLTRNFHARLRRDPVDGEIRLVRECALLELHVLAGHSDGPWKMSGFILLR
ncbi:Uu.00g030710.m01.CDS01 [Anthostomella pinea]|uniref:Uu.00g030710.m01.CDS01 n=1 Tax=Anthostomella pinea TaxID=933095 RepID=A0AAI8V8E2_9PEZI|nr:Uu.00g030710.m01.CDS01 [Anthostomella pinea]